MKMVLARDYRLMSTKGYSVLFAKNTPVDVPDPAVREAVSIGAVAVDGTDVDPTPEDRMPNMGPRDRETRDKEIEDAIRKLIAANNKEDFNAAGVPTVEALSRVAGYKITSAERNPVWTRVHAVE